MKGGKLSNYLQILLYLFMSLLMSINGQQNDICAVSQSQTMIGYRNAYCRCDQSLPQNVGSVDHLTIDQSECATYTALNISWVNLEKGISFRAITFIGTEIILMPPVAEVWQSMVQRIKFIQCIFDSISTRAFEGLAQLEELRFENNYFGSINSYAISNLPNLETVEFSDSSIRNIQAYAISGLPNLFELAFVRCDIVGLGKNAIHNLRTPELPISPDCPEIDIRFGNDRDERLLNGMERRLESTENLPLPEFGSRLLFYQSNISIIEDSAVESNIFAFVIFAGNRIIYFGQKALNVELSNQCEISSLMIVGNTFETVEPDSFAYALSRQQASYSTYFIMTNNTFHLVLQNGFRLHPTLKIFSVLDNKFLCQCSNFKWHFHSQMAAASRIRTRQEELEENLITTGQCISDKSSVEYFVSTCPDEEMTTIATVPTILYTVHNSPEQSTTTMRITTVNGSLVHGANVIIVTISALLIMLTIHCK